MTHLIHRHPLLHLMPKTEMNLLTTPHPMTNRTRPRTVAPNDQLDYHDRCNWLFDIQKIYLEPVGFEPHKTMSRLHYRQPISGKSSIHLFPMQPVRARSFDLFLSFFSHVVPPSHGSLHLFSFPSCYLCFLLAIMSTNSPCDPSCQVQRSTIVFV